MKTRYWILLVGIIITSSVIFALTVEMPLDDVSQNSFQSPSKRVHYSIEIVGMKDTYFVGEQYDFSYIISGYGYECGGKVITFPNKDGEIMGMSSSSSCLAGVPMKDFVYDSQKSYGTMAVHSKVNTPGIYNVTATFDRPSHGYPTTAIHEFEVINYMDANIPESLKKVLDSCANDSPKERMANPLRYTNDTHVFLNHGCEWKLIGEYLGEIENEKPVPLDIASIEDGRIALNPVNMCAALTLELPTKEYIQRFINEENGLKENGLKENIILQITDEDLKEIPDIRELISAVHSIEFPYNKYSSASLDGLTFVEYEFFLMEKAMKKYGDSQDDYFIKLDKDYEERFTNPKKQGFTNQFIAPLIVYNEKVYSIDGVYFWTSDEHKPKRMGVYPIDDIKDDEKFVTLTDEDMKSVPKIKDAIENIGTVRESISGYKGLPENEWNEYREWFKQKSLDRLYAEWFRFIQYNEQLYSVGFSIC